MIFREGTIVKSTHTIKRGMRGVIVGKDPKHMFVPKVWRVHWDDGEYKPFHEIHLKWVGEEETTPFAKSVRAWIQSGATKCLRSETR